jgi:hypothetical protein
MQFSESAHHHVKISNNNSSAAKGKKVKFYDDGIYYIRYCIAKQTGEEISISLLRLAFKFFTEYLIYVLLTNKPLSFLNLGVFYTKKYPESIRRSKSGDRIYIPSFFAPSINFSETIRKALKSRHFDFHSPEFLAADKKDFKGLFHSIRLIDYSELQIPEPPDESDLLVPFFDNSDPLSSDSFILPLDD